MQNRANGSADIGAARYIWEKHKGTVGPTLKSSVPIPEEAPGRPIPRNLLGDKSQKASPPPSQVSWPANFGRVRKEKWVRMSTPRRGGIEPGISFTGLKN